MIRIPVTIANYDPYVYTVSRRASVTKACTFEVTGLTRCDTERYNLQGDIETLKHVQSLQWSAKSEQINVY